MSFGAWEGRTRAELKQTDRARLAEQEPRGLDMTPPGGESPRMVQERVRPWLIEIEASQQDTGAVCHKAVIRALYAQATGWDMTGPMPDTLDWNALHLFLVTPGGGLAVERLNVPLRTMNESAAS
jgi:probable phosphoglycerate mutase